MIYHDEAPRVDRRRIEQALDDIKTFGDSFQVSVACFIEESELVLFVGPVSIVRGSGSVQLDNQGAARDAVAQRFLTRDEAAAYVRLNIARETIDTGGQRGIEGTLVHEGKHALDFAMMLSTFSSGQQSKVFNPTAFQRELSAHLTAAFYLKRRGGEYSDEGLSLGLLENRNGILAVSVEGIRGRLKNRYGLSEETPGARLDSAANPKISLRV